MVLKRKTKTFSQKSLANRNSANRHAAFHCCGYLKSGNSARRCPFRQEEEQKGSRQKGNVGNGCGLKQRGSHVLRYERFTKRIDLLFNLFFLFFFFLFFYFFGLGIITFVSAFETSFSILDFSIRTKATRRYSFFLNDFLPKRDFPYPITFSKLYIRLYIFFILLWILHRYCLRIDYRIDRCYLIFHIACKYLKNIILDYKIRSNLKDIPIDFYIIPEDQTNLTIYTKYFKSIIHSFNFYSYKIKYESFHYANSFYVTRINSPNITLATFTKRMY